MKTVLLFPLLGALAWAADATPTVLFTDDFNRAELGPQWSVLWKDVTVVDGAMKGSQAVAGHGAVARTKVQIRDGGVEFRFRLSEGTAISAVWNDREYKESHGGHICRIVVKPGLIQLGDDKEGMRHEIVEMKKDPARKAEAAKLLEPRTASLRVPIEVGRWYTVRSEIVGDEMRAFLDGREVGRLKSSGIAHPVKKDLHFTLSGPDTRVDDLKVWSTPTR